MPSPQPPEILRLDALYSNQSFRERLRIRIEDYGLRSIWLGGERDWGNIGFFNDPEVAVARMTLETSGFEPLLNNIAYEMNWGRLRDGDH